MKKELFGITREDISDKNSYILEYYLTETTEQTDDVVYTGYGMEIKKLVPNDGKSVEEVSSVHNVYTNRVQAESFLQLLIDCKVTPVHLKDITMDFIQNSVDNCDGFLCTA